MGAGEDDIGVTAGSKSEVRHACGGVCWARPPQHSPFARGTKLHGKVAVQSRGPGNTHREVNLHPAGQPHNIYCVCCVTYATDMVHSSTLLVTWARRLTADMLTGVTVYRPHTPAPRWLKYNH